MPTGDTLQVMGLAIGMMACALTTSGWKKNLFWFLAVFFALLSLVYADALPQFGLPIESINRAITALLAPIILGGVALMLRDRRVPVETVNQTSDESFRPAFAVSPTTKWSPDITLQQGVGYLGAQSVWRDPFRGGNTVDGTTDAIVAALEAKKITAWGRAHPGEGELFEISESFWIRADVTLDTDYAFSHVQNIGAYNVHLCQKEMEQVWPPKES